MGYSVCVKFKNAAEQQKMNDFYSSNSDIVESLSKAEGRGDVQNYLELHVDDRLSYAPKAKYLLGFDGPSGRPYYFELLITWMAVKSTYRDKSNEAFFYYDNEKIKINQNDSFLMKVNEQGIQTGDTFSKLFKENKTRLEFNLFGVKDFEKYGKTVEELFSTLEERWQKLEVAPKPKKAKL
jgi:hypothetical protein